MSRPTDRASAAAKTNWLSGDVARDDPVRVFDRADVVINLAWPFQPTHDPRTTCTNVLGSRLVLTRQR
ncbi:hypothetical protein CC117_29170 [Parafrankia colletiae]|uniref:Uncharacterized protein n=1 Tax=Parafrankia colletiae TaxID=573497 RepID=A0A1S1Q798_9ACTN|nr:hypothetical protein [Frankia sp. Cpl3]OHV29466.1 hypothetical protein CC117_29170 [Parafrankia colletiae]